jgi:potassium-dependent mechanosensitive channel
MPFRPIHAGRAVALIAAFVCVLAAAVGRAQTNGELAAALQPLKLSLDVIGETVKDARTDQALADLARRLAPLRDELHGKIETLEPRLAQVDTRRKQLGDAPAANAPPEDRAIAAERTRLADERGELDATLKQARLLALRADQLAEHIAERRRGLLAGRLLARSAGLLDPVFWREAARGLTAESAAVGALLQSSWAAARDKIGSGGVAALALVLAGFAAAAVLLARAWRRRLLARPVATRFGRALAAVIVLLGVMLVAPAVVIAAVLACESLGVVSAELSGIGYGIAAAILMARFGRGAALALFAPGDADRRLIGFHDGEARVFAEHLSWGARLFGAAVVLNVVFKATAAPVALTTATSALMSLAIACVAIHLLAVFPRGAPDGEGRADSRLSGLRVVLWLFVATVLFALAAGYIGLASFVAGRFLAALALLCALYIVLVFVDALFTEVLTGDTAAGRAVAALLGVTPRGLELAGTLLSAALRIVIVLVVVPPLLGPWGLFATDVFDFLAQVASGIRVAGITISLTAILTAFVWLVVGVLAARGAQRWLETRFMPRTGIDPSLQHSAATLIGYALLIAAITLALAHLGIEPQQIALVAGALSVGIGFGLQSIVSNFVSGIILLAERPIRVGDWVVVKNEEGIVRRISVRATEIETFDRASVIIPNSEFITGPVKNLTHSDTMGRITVKVRAAYDSDVDAVRDLLVACACEHPQVLQTPPPRVFLMALGDFALELELRCIVANVNYGLTVKSDLQMEILRRFRAAGIKIPVLPHEEPVPGGPPAAPKSAPGA